MIGVLLLGTVGVAVLLEMGLRMFGSLNIHYYTGTKRPGLHRYPYGDVPINTSGFPDEEFVGSDIKRRVGYVGDSVTFGVGAGYGYRVPDLLQDRYPQYDHWVFAGVGDRLDQRILIDEVTRFRLNAVVYLMNLNDVVPDPGDAAASTFITRARETWFGSLDESLRGTSYLYTYLRLGIKNGLQHLGYEGTGFPAFELFPETNRGVVEGSARRIADALDAAQRVASVTTCVVILPYEMQVSPAAAQRYRDLGYSWEAGFEAGSTQRYLTSILAQRGIRVFDGRDAFRGLDLGVGEAFVYDRGDKVDWNHPNRRGHALLAAWLAEQPEFVARCFGTGRP